MRAQIKIFETVGVLAIFFILLTISAAVYFEIHEKRIERELARQQRLFAFEGALRMTWLPELDCSFLGIKKERCFDLAKVVAFEEQKESFKAAYFELFGFANITIRQILPESRTYQLYFRAPPEIKRQWPVRVPIALQNLTSRGYAFGILEIIGYG